jgi:hypothetical protein
MRFFTYQIALRFFAGGFAVMFLGFGVNKVGGAVSLGVTLSFVGFGFCVAGLFLVMITWIKEKIGSGL